MNANMSISTETNTDFGWPNHLDMLPGFQNANRLWAQNQARDEVLCTVYDHLRDDFEVFEARVENKSDAGLVFTTNRQLKVGTPILVRLKQIPEKDTEDDLKDGVHAQVVWCKRIHNTDQSLCYQAAIEYFEPCH